MTVPGPSPKSASPLWISYVRTEWWLTTERTRHPSCQRLDHRITGCSPCHPIHFQSLSPSNARIFQHHQMGKHRQRNLGLSSETCETLWHCRQSRAVVTVSNKVSPLTLPLSPSQKVLPPRNMLGITSEMARIESALTLLLRILHPRSTC